MKATSPQLVGNDAALLVTMVLPGKPLDLQRVVRYDEPELLHSQEYKARLATVGAANYVDIQRDLSEHLPFGKGWKIRSEVSAGIPKQAFM